MVVVMVVAIGEEEVTVMEIGAAVSTLNRSGELRLVALDTALPRRHATLAREAPSRADETPSPGRRATCTNEAAMKSTLCGTAKFCRSLMSFACSTGRSTLTFGKFMFLRSPIDSFTGAVLRAQVGCVMRC